MKHILTYFYLILLTIFIIGGDLISKEEFPVLKGPYLGQKPPGMKPKIFAPGILSTGHHEHSSPAFSADGREVYWSVFFYFRSPQVILWRFRRPPKDRTYFLLCQGRPQGNPTLGPQSWS